MSTLFDNETASFGWIDSVVNSISQKESVVNHSWICATICSALVGLSGLFPILLLPKQDENGNETKKDNPANSAPASNLRFLLSFEPWPLDLGRTVDRRRSRDHVLY